MLQEIFSTLKSQTLCKLQCFGFAFSVRGRAGGAVVKYPATSWVIRRWGWPPSPLLRKVKFKVARLELPFATSGFSGTTWFSNKSTAELPSSLVLVAGPRRVPNSDYLWQYFLDMGFSCCRICKVGSISMHVSHWKYPYPIPLYWLIGNYSVYPLCLIITPINQVVQSRIITNQQWYFNGSLGRSCECEPDVVLPFVVSTIWTSVLVNWIMVAGRVKTKQCH